MNALNDATNTIEAMRGGAPKDQGERTSRARPVPGALDIYQIPVMSRD